MSDSYGLFEAVEEMNFPSSGSTNDLSTVETKTVKVKHDESTFVGKILTTFDKINNNQFESTESLATLGSFNSMTSMSSVQSQPESFPEKVFHTVEALTLNDYGSTNSLNEINNVSTKQDESTLVGKVLKTMDRINNNQFASTDSLASMNSSSSMNSMSSAQSEVDFLAPKHIFGAVQSLTLNNYASTNSLQSIEDSSTPLSPPSDKAAQSNGNVVSQFIEVVGEFMHNHDSQSGPIPAPAAKSGREPVPIEEIETVFPKFC